MVNIDRIRSKGTIIKYQIMQLLLLPKSFFCFFSQSQVEQPNCFQQNTLFFYLFLYELSASSISPQKIILYDLSCGKFYREFLGNYIRKISHTTDSIAS